jgi:acyl-coenzyme A synthetase/AMP-(fatty) acid ligase
VEPGLTPSTFANPILEAFTRQVRDRPDGLAVWSRGEGLRLRFAELDELVASLAAALRGAGNAPAAADAPVALATGNAAVFPAAYLALRRAGRPVVAVDGALAPAEKLRLCRRLGLPHLLHREPELGGTALPGGGWWLDVDGVEPVELPRSTGLVKLTSGTTGEPVGACFSDQAMLAGIAQIGGGMGITAADTVLMAIPLSHSYGFDNGVLSLAVLGTPLVLEPAFYPAPLIAALHDAQATVLPLVPPLVRALGASSWPPGDALALRLVISAGGPLPGDAAAAFFAASGRRVHQFYGSTESGGISFERAPEDPAALGTVGHPLPGVRVELDEEGRVEVRSPANHHGHLGRDRQPAPRVVTPGDRGEWTPEGRLRLLGRSVEVLNVGGRKIPVLAIEEALRAVAGVEDAAVVGLADATRGDRIVAFVVSARERLDLSALPRGYAPREVRRVASLPYTERGKLDRSALRELAQRR